MIGCPQSLGVVLGLPSAVLRLLSVEVEGVGGHDAVGPVHDLCFTLIQAMAAVSCVMCNV